MSGSNKVNLVTFPRWLRKPEQRLGLFMYAAVLLKCILIRFLADCTARCMMILFAW